MNVCMSVNHGRLNVKRDILKMKRTKERMICIYFHVCGKLKNIKATPIVFSLNKSYSNCFNFVASSHIKTVNGLELK